MRRKHVLCEKPETGGGGLYDIGCYACATARLIFDDEPLRAMALIEGHRDRLGSGRSKE